MTQTDNKPIATIKDGRLKATIWQNTSKNGTLFRVNFSRSYQDGAGKWHDTDSFSGSETLRIGHLAARAYDNISTLRAKVHVANETETTPGDGRRS